MFSYSRFEHQEAKSHFVYERPLSEDYQVWVNGEPYETLGD